MKYSRRSFFQMIPFLGMACTAEAEKPSLTFEEELRKLIFNSPHLYHFMAEGRFNRCHVFLDGQEIHLCTEFVGDPHPNVKVRGAVLSITDRYRFITEWKIGDVSWCPIK